MEPPGSRQLEQGVIRKRAPQEERQSGSKLAVADTLREAWLRGFRLLLDAKQKVWTREYPLQRHPNAFVERALGTPFFVERHQHIDVSAGHRTAIRTARQRRHDP